MSRSAQAADLDTLPRAAGDAAGAARRRDRAGERPRVLYLTRTGLLEPLGLSQVLRYLFGLSRDFAITIVSFERKDDLADARRLTEIRRACEAHGIHWLPQAYSGQARNLDAVRDIARMVRIGLSESRRSGIDLIHARSYIPAMAAALLARLTDRPYIFDMRALWPEELITSGRLRRGSRTHRLLVRAERLCLRRAAATVSLTRAALGHLDQVHPGVLPGGDVIVIPTCVDLRLFTPRAEKGKGPATYGCLGSVRSGWFRLDWLGAFFRLAAAREPEARFDIVTRDDPEAVRAVMAEAGVPLARLSIRMAAPDEVPGAIRDQDVNVMFYAGGAISELGRSPTRLAEVLACGVPVIANRGVGDVAEVVESERVGVIAEDGSPEALRRAYEAFRTLRDDAGLASRCRAAAERIYALEAGTQAYRTLYRRVLGIGHGTGEALG